MALRLSDKLESCAGLSFREAEAGSGVILIDVDIEDPPLSFPHILFDCNGDFPDILGGNGIAV